MFRIAVVVRRPVRPEIERNSIASFDCWLASIICRVLRRKSGSPGSGEHFSFYSPLPMLIGRKPILRADVPVVLENKLDAMPIKIVDKSNLSAFSAEASRYA